MKARSVSSPGHEDFAFGAEDVQEGVADRQTNSDRDAGDEAEEARTRRRAAAAGKLTQVIPLQLDQNGTARRDARQAAHGSRARRTWTPR